jgi:hypothetical protein
MSIIPKQIEFTNCLWRLLRYAEEQGYGVTMGDVWDSDGDGGHMANSVHNSRMAADLNLFIKDEEGEWTWVSNGKDPAWLALGMFWENVSDNARWGGRFRKNDSNHFSFSHGGRA